MPYDKVMDERVVGGIEGCCGDRLGCGTIYRTYCNGHWDAFCSLNLLYSGLCVTVLYRTGWGMA